MCELLGVSIDRPERPTFAFAGFQEASKIKKEWRKSNPDGWGLGCYPKDGLGAFIIKEPVAAIGSPLAKVVRDGLQPESKTHLLHVRRRSGRDSKKPGPAPIHVNTHPFSRVVEDREFIFAHNGGLKDHRQDPPLGRYHCLGQTTSEYAFCYILRKASLIRNHKWRQVQELLLKINTYGNFNCILSDGEYMLVYRDVEGYKGLSFVERHAPYPKIVLKDNTQYRVDLQLSQDSSRKALLFATNPFTDGENWHELPPGRLTVAKEGETVWQG